MPWLHEQKDLTIRGRRFGGVQPITAMPENNNPSPLVKKKKQEPALLRWQVVFKRKINGVFDVFECEVKGASPSQARRQAVCMAEGHGQFWVGSARASLRNLGEVKP